MDDVWCGFVDSHVGSVCVLGVFFVWVLLVSNQNGHFSCMLGSGGVKMCAMLLWAWMMRF